MPTAAAIRFPTSEVQTATISRYPVARIVNLIALHMASMCLAAPGWTLNHASPQSGVSG
ncbi:MULTISPECIES: hypothetical protein [unclassified Mesorhizobium]|uniref:hypothetical protein n=1 Tax=unclassified Mesorhizobium TaxID=325217 RepID=UPI00167B9C26|nr:MULTISPECIES: hypothetical protein [unclassified Mesorhizobium]